MLIALSLSIVSAGTIIFFSRRLLCYLRHFQEVDYCKTNFKDWLLENGVYDKKGSVIAAIAALAIELTKEKIILSLIISTIATAGLIWLSVWEEDPRKSGFPKLETTRQSTTIYNIALGLYSILVVGTILTVYLLGADEDIACYWLVTIIAIQSSPIWLVLSSSLYKRI